MCSHICLVIRSFRCTQSATQRWSYYLFLSLIQPNSNCGEWSRCVNNNLQRQSQHIADARPAVLAVTQHSNTKVVLGQIGPLMSTHLSKHTHKLHTNVQLHDTWLTLLTRYNWYKPRIWPSPRTCWSALDAARDQTECHMTPALNVHPAEIPPWEIYETRARPPGSSSSAQHTRYTTNYNEKAKLADSCVLAVPHLRVKLEIVGACVQRDALLNEAAITYLHRHLNVHKKSILYKIQ